MSNGLLVEQTTKYYYLLWECRQRTHQSTTSYQQQVDVFRFVLDGGESGKPFTFVTRLIQIPCRFVCRASSLGHVSILIFELPRGVWLKFAIWILVWRGPKLLSLLRSWDPKSHSTKNKVIYFLLSQKTNKTNNNHCRKSLSYSFQGNNI